MKRNDFPESIGINRKMTGNDRKNDRITSENDRKRPQDLPSVLPLRGMDSSEIPRIFPDFPCIFLDISIKFLIFALFFIFNRIIYYKVWKKKI